MSKLLAFLRTIYIFVLFIIVECVAVVNYANSNGYTHAKIAASSSYITGGIGSFTGSIGNFVRLGSENRLLTERVAQLESQLDYYQHIEDEQLTEDLEFNPLHDVEGQTPYSYTPARVIANSLNKIDNFIVINRGLKDGVGENMALLSPAGELVGYISSANDNYAVATSALNSEFKTSGKLLGDAEYSGSIIWSGEDKHTMRMNDLSKYAPIEVGDSIMSTGYSQIFPEGVLIGRVTEFNLNQMQTAYEVELELAADISALNRVVVVGNSNYDEIQNLIKESGFDTL